MVAVTAVALVATVLVGTPGISASAPAGVVDGTFGVNGRVRVNVQGPDFVSQDALHAVVVQPDGNILTAGWGGNPYGDFVLMRVHPDGTFDDGFGVNGIARNAFSASWDEATALTLQPDGKPVAGGFVRRSNGSDDVAVVRYLSNGTVDTSFSGDGIATGLFSFVYYPSFIPQIVNALVVQPDGKILAVVEGISSSNGFLVLRLQPDGTLDPSFGDGGRAFFSHQTGKGIALQPDGRILVVGSTLEVTQTNPQKMAVTRLDSAGAFDPTFGMLGMLAATNHAASAGADAIALLPDGRIVFGGAGSTGYAAQLALARVWPDGSLDASFGTGGYVNTTITGTEDRVRSMALQPDGKLVVVGGTMQGNTRPWVIARYNVNGLLDGTFDNDGIALFHTEGTAFGVALAPEGAYVAGPEGTGNDLVLYRIGLGSIGAPPTTTQPPSTTSTAPAPTTSQPPPNADPTIGSRYVALDATRVLDTRATGKVGARGTADATVVGADRAPNGATAVVVNVTATDADAPGYVTVWPAGTTRPEVSSLNIGSTGGTIANLVTVPLTASGALSLFSEAGAQLVVDLVGYYVPVDAPVSSGRFQPVTPVRVLDTRAFGAAPAVVDLDVRAIGGLPGAGASAIVANLTAVDSTSAGFVTVWPGSQPQPVTSNLNLDAAQQTRANQVIVAVGNGTVRLATASGAHLIVDVVGYITNDATPAATSGLFVPFAPTRLLDTRSGIGARAGLAGKGEQLGLATAGRIPVANPLALVGNLTATQSVGPGFVAMWSPAGAPRPEVSTINLDATDQTRANHTMVAMGVDGTVSLYSEAGAHLVLDVAGAFRR